MTSSLSSGVSTAPMPAAEDPGPRWERWALWLILAGFVAAGINHVRTNTFMGQDFAVHTYATDELLKNPWRWFPQDFTNRPMIYWVGELGHWLTHGTLSYAAAAFICVFLNALALAFLHASTRNFIRSPWLRLSAVAFVGFLPSTQVSVVVYAGDAVGPLPFAFSIWALLRSLTAGPGRVSAAYAVLAALGLCLGNFARMPFLVLPAAGLVALLLMWSWRQIAGRRALLIGALGLLAPIIVGSWVHRRAVREFAAEPPHHVIDWNGTGDMTWIYLLFVLPSDVRIFDAPGYWDPVAVEGGYDFSLPLSQNYSYPALFHLSIYTDVLNYANDGQLNNEILRPEPQKTYSRWAVRWGVLTTLGAVFAMLSLLVRAVVALTTRRDSPLAGPLVWGLMALAWYLPLVLVLPYVQDAYRCGYWLPRIVLPALWGFGMVFFAELDQRLAARPRWITLLVAGFIFAQAALHLRSVWY